ncbi:TolC family protein [Mesonia maritima]|uniref:Outer membrane protein n=2 Tax=Mesonia maritima TaxID=1793873 RepID=A0ABU1K3J0_9FLAO|nr:TolC family protein [Mesonia maritima]MDR6300188.1 outer membrane protein [Mesonia maritima]
MKNSILILLLLCVGFSASAQNKKWTLRECIEYALDNNISIKQSQLDLEASEIDKSDAIGNYLPSINAQASNSWNTGLTQNVTTGVLQNQTTRNFSAGVTLGVNIFNGLNNLRQYQRAKMARIASMYSLEKMEDDIMLFVANAYLDVLVNKETVKVLKEQNQVTQEQYKRTQDLVDAGSLPRGDLLEIKATNADERQQIIVAENSVRIALINLAQLLLIDDYKNFDIVDETYDVPISDILQKSPEEIIENAKDERYEIKIAESNVELAEKDVQIAKSNYLPSISGFFNYNTRESGSRRVEQFTTIDEENPTQVIGQVAATGQDVISDNFSSGFRTLPPRPFIDQLWLNDGISYGLQLNVPILNGFSTRNSVRRNEINVQRAEYQLEQARLDLESNVYQAYVDAQGAAEAYQAAEVAVESQQLAYDYSQERYDVGLTNAFDFSQSKFRLSNAQSQLIRSKYDYIFKLKVLELYFGIEPEDIKL